MSSQPAPTDQPTNQGQGGAANGHASSEIPTDVLLYTIAIFLPPLSVYFKCQCHGALLINICLWILGWIPGVIHAL